MMITSRSTQTTHSADGFSWKARWTARTFFHCKDEVVSARSGDSVEDVLADRQTHDRVCALFQ